MAKQEMTEAAALRMKIVETEVSVAWEDNATVAALRELAGRGPLVIELRGASAHARRCAELLAQRGDIHIREIEE